MFKKAAFSGGIHPSENKLTHNCPITQISDISLVRIPMNMHIGAPCKPIVKAREHVDVGQVIGEPSGIAVPIHASVSGTVKSVKNEMLANGSMVDIIEITSDNEMTLHESVQPASINSKEEFLQAVKASGLVGLGGAGFPTHIKLSPPADKYPDVLLINAMECEPYITSDDRQCLEQPDQIIAGISLILKFMEIPKAIIGIEKNKPDAAKSLKAAVKKANAQNLITVAPVPTRYPQGAEKTMIQVLTNRIVPAGGLPMDVHVVVMNVTTVNKLETYCRTGMPLVSKIITLAGDAVQTPGNYEVPIGTKISEVIEKAGGLKKDAKKILMGGPMMGIAVSDIDSSIVKNNNAILVFHDQAKLPEESPCIRCSRCITVCPMQLMPTSLDYASRAGNFTILDDNALMNCIECGSCSYICPAKRQLVQNIRIGKIFYRNEMQKEAVAK